MKKCTKCSLEVNSTRKTCPLCLSILEDDGGEYIKKYPVPLNEPAKKSLFLRILSFLSIVAIFVTVVVNLMTYKEGGTWWSIIVVFNIGYFWLLIKSTFRKKGNVALRLVFQTLAISIVTYVIDYFTSQNFHGWAINYVFPFITMASLLSISALTLGSKRRYVNYFIHIITSIALCLIPIILYWVGLITVSWPAISSAMLAFSSLVAIVILGDKDTKEEIKKRLHI